MTREIISGGRRARRPHRSVFITLFLALLLVLNIAPLQVIAAYNVKYLADDFETAPKIGTCSIDPYEDDEQSEYDVYSIKVDVSCDALSVSTDPAVYAYIYFGNMADDLGIGGGLSRVKRNDEYFNAGLSYYSNIKGRIQFSEEYEPSANADLLLTFVYWEDDETNYYVVIEWEKGSTVDKTALNTAIQDSENLAESDFYNENDRYNGKPADSITDKSSGFWKEMQTALSSAKTVSGDAAATQGEVDSATSALTGTAIRLIPKEQLNATALYEAIEVERARGLEASDYTEYTWAPYQNAKSEAEAYLDSLFETEDGVVVPTEINKAENQSVADGYIAPIQATFNELLKQKDYDNFVNTLTYSDARWLVEKSAELKLENFTADSWNLWDDAYKDMRLAMEDGYETKTTMGRYGLTCRLAKEAYYALEDSHENISVSVRVQDNYGTKNPQWALDAFSGSYEKEITLSGDKSIAALITAMEADGCDIAKGGAGYGDQRNQVFVLLLINGELAPEYLHKSPVYSDNTKVVQLRQGDDILLLRTVVPTDTYYIHHTATPFSYGWYQSEAGIATLDSPQLLESGHIEMEAGSELDISATKISASINIRDKMPKPFAGAAVFISEAAESKEAAKASLALTNTGALTDEQGNAEFRVLESGWYKVSAVDIREQVTSQTDAYGNTIFGSLPNAVAGSYILVYASEPADSTPIKAEFKSELDEVYSRYGEEFYGSERFAAVESAYAAACEVFANSESTIKEGFNAKEGAVALIREKISETETENTRVAYNVDKFYLCLPKSADELNKSNMRHFEGLKALYDEMTVYQRSCLTTAQEKLYRELLAAYGEDGSTLPDGEKQTIRIELEIEYPEGMTSHGIFCRVNGSGYGYYKRNLENERTYETELNPGDILDVYFTTQGTTNKPRVSAVEVLQGSVTHEHVSVLRSNSNNNVGRKFEFEGTPGTEILTWQDMIKLVGGNSDTVIRVSFGEKHESLSELDEAKNAALAALKTAYDGYNKPEYSAENWASLATAYNDGMAEIRNADSVEAVGSAKDAAIAAMAAVQKGFGQSSGETVGSLGSVHVVIENTTYMDAPFTGTIAEAYIPLEDDTTMMTAVLDTLEGKGFAWRNSTGLADKSISYLASISKDGEELGEFDGGPQSGWMGTLNDWFTNEGFQSFKAIAGRRDYRLVDGDEIRIMYTKDGYGNDLGGTWYNSDTSLKELRVSGGSLHPAFDGQVKEYLLIKDGSAVSVLPTAANKNYQVKTFVNGINKERDVDYYRRGENIPVVAGDSINIGVGEHSWLSMNNQGAEARFYSGSWYTIHIVDKESNAAVEAMINSIGSFEYSNYKDKQTGIELAGKAYDSLGEAAKERVSNAETLELASEKLASYLKIDNVKNLLSGLVQSSRATDAQVLAAKRDIEKVDAAYRALSDEQKGYITVGDVENYNELVGRLSALTATQAEQIEGSEFAPGGENLKPEAKVDGKEAKASVTEQELSSAVKAAKAGEQKAVTIAPEGADDAKSVAVSVPTAAAKEMAAEKDVDLNVETSAGNVSVPAEALASIAESAEGSDIAINVAVKEESDVKDESVDTSSGIVVAVTVTSGGKQITSFGGKSITIDIPVGDKYVEGRTYSVVQISADGSKQMLDGKCVKIGDKLYVRVSVSHLSTFVVLGGRQMKFVDVANHWAKAGIQYVFDRGIMSGTAETKFSPDAKLSRAMLVTMLHNLEGAPKPGSAAAFTDVEAGKWYADAISWAAANGIVSGVGEGKFAPNVEITREQIATILHNYAKYKKYDTTKAGDLSVFADSADISDWALPALKWANGEGLIKGRTKSTMVPKGIATRAEAAVILTFFLENVVK